MSELKDTINRNISDNTSGDITAEIMRETLNLIVDYAEKGYKYGGLVSPQDGPVLPGDIPSVYIARYKGAYINFSNTKIYQDGLYLFMNNGNGRYYLITLYMLEDKLGDNAYALLSQKTITKVLNNLETNIFKSLSNVESSLSSNITAYADGRTSILPFDNITNGSVLYEYAPYTETPAIFLHQSLDKGFVMLVNGRYYAYWNEYISNRYGTGIVHDHTYYNDENSQAKPGLYYNISEKHVQLISSMYPSKDEFLVDKTYAESRYINKEDLDKIELPELAEVAISGSYNDLKDKPNIPNDFYTRGEVDGKLAIKSDKTSVIVSQTSDKVTLYADKRHIVELIGDVTFILDATHDTYAHSYEIDLNVGDTAYSVSFPAEITWIKDLEIVANSRYMIVIDYNGVAYTAMYVVTGE